MKRALLGVATALLITLTACGSDSTVKTTAQDNAVETATNRNNYIPKNDIEGHNYNARMIMSDNPATVIWCTAFPTNPNVFPFTVPIVGKLTSGGKRPFPTQVVRDFASDSSGKYNPELPGSDGFYGQSGEYRYGFDPAGHYHDFYNIETYCTDVPSIIVDHVIKVDVSVTDADVKVATDALNACRKANPDPSVPCAAADTALTSDVTP